MQNKILQLSLDIAQLIEQSKSVGSNRDNTDYRIALHQVLGLLDLDLNNIETEDTYSKEDIEKAYRAGEYKKTYYFKDTTVILPDNYEGVEG